VGTSGTHPTQRPSCPCAWRRPSPRWTPSCGVQCRMRSPDGHQSADRHVNGNERERDRQSQTEREREREREKKKQKRKRGRARGERRESLPGQIDREIFRERERARVRREGDALTRSGKSEAPGVRLFLSHSLCLSVSIWPGLPAEARPAAEDQGRKALGRTSGSPGGDEEHSLPRQIG
jgi:hypothetical protein